MPGLTAGERCHFQGSRTALVNARGRCLRQMCGSDWRERDEVARESASRALQAVSYDGRMAVQRCRTGHLMKTDMVVARQPVAAKLELSGAGAASHSADAARRPGMW